MSPKVTFFSSDSGSRSTFFPIIESIKFLSKKSHFFRQFRGRKWPLFRHFRGQFRHFRGQKNGHFRGQKNVTFRPRNWAVWTPKVARNGRFLRSKNFKSCEKLMPASGWALPGPMGETRFEWVSERIQAPPWVLLCFR